MDIDKIQMPKEKAKEEWKRYNELIKKRHDKYLDDMKKCMYQLKEGRELIDIYKVLEKAGLNKECHPRMAISRADWKKVCFHKKDSGRGFFSENDSSWASNQKGDIDLHPNTFMEWARSHEERLEHNSKNKLQVQTWEIDKPRITTKVPIIPSQLIPEDDLSNYYILWEVDRWEELPKQDDPLLLKRITENLFVILSAWDVTELEQSIISAR